MFYKYVVKNVAHAHGKVATFMPKPLYGDNGSGMHTHQSLFKDDEPLMFDTKGYAGISPTSAAGTSAACSSHAARILAFAAPDDQQLQAPRPRLRGASEPGVLCP